MFFATPCSQFGDGRRRIQNDCRATSAAGSTGAVPTNFGRVRRSLHLMIVVVLAVLQTGATASGIAEAGADRAVAAHVMPASLLVVQRDNGSARTQSNEPPLVPLPGHGQVITSPDDHDHVGNPGALPVTAGTSSASRAVQTRVQTFIVREDPLTRQYTVQVNGDAVIRGGQIDEIATQLQRRVQGVSLRLSTPDGRTLRLIPRTRLGVLLEPVPAALRSHLRLGDDEGLLVTNVMPNLPAALAGVQQFDVLMSVAGEEPLTQMRLTEVLAQREPGETISIVAIRGGREIEVHARLIENEITDASGPLFPGQIAVRVEAAAEGSSSWPTPSTHATEIFSGVDLRNMLRSGHSAGSEYAPVAIERRAEDGTVIEFMQWANPITESLLTGRPMLPAVSTEQVTPAQIEELNQRLDRIEQMLELLLNASNPGRVGSAAPPAPGGKPGGGPFMSVSLSSSLTPGAADETRPESGHHH